MIIAIPFTRDYEITPWHGGKITITLQGFQLTCERCGWEGHYVKKPDTGYWMDESDKRKLQSDLADYMVEHEVSCPARTESILIQNGVPNALGQHRPSFASSELTYSAATKTLVPSKNETKP